MNQKVTDYHSLVIELLKEPNQEIKNYLSEMILGTPGKLGNSAYSRTGRVLAVESDTVDSFFF